MRNELLKGARPRGILCVLLFLAETVSDLQDSARHQYVEVVLRGEIEGKFLEDPEAHRDEMMGQVSRLGEILLMRSRTRD